MVKIMAQGGKGLAAFALIIGLLGAGAGGFYLVNEFLLKPDVVPVEEVILPKARLYSTETPSITSGTTITINFTDATFDTHNAYNYSTSQYVIPEAGIYEISAQFAIYADLGDFLVIQLFNGTALKTRRATTASRPTNYFGVTFSDLYNASAGDRLSIKAYSYNTGAFSRAIFGGQYHTFFCIAKLP